MPNEQSIRKTHEAPAEPAGPAPGETVSHAPLPAAAVPADQLPQSEDRPQEWSGDMAGLPDKVAIQFSSGTVVQGFQVLDGVLFRDWPAPQGVEPQPHCAKRSEDTRQNTRPLLHAHILQGGIGGIFRKP